MNDLKNSFKIFKLLSKKETILKVEKEIIDGYYEVDINKEIIEKTVNIITTLIKQMKLSKELKSITLKTGTNEHPFPPSVIILCGEDNLEIFSEFVKHKELHYELSSISADYNTMYSNNVPKIIETYQNIITKLKQYKWKSICSVSERFDVNYIR